MSSQKKNPHQLDFSQTKWPHQIQVLEIENFGDFTDTVQQYVSFLCEQSKTEFRLINDENKKLLAVILNTDGSLTLREFDRKFTISHGVLEPLKKNRGLFYDANLELKENTLQRIEIAPHVTAQFELRDQVAFGGITRGSLFQKFFNFQAEKLVAYPKLFYTLKRMEQYFVHRNTDSFYQNINQELEDAVRMVKLRSPGALEHSLRALSQAQKALEYVFTGDKLLKLLIRDLQNTLSSNKELTMAPALQSLEASEPCLSKNQNNKIFHPGSDLTN